VHLEKPDIDRYIRNGPSFFALTENRVSHRAYSGEPMTLADLEALLYLSSRVKTRYEAESYEATSRPYPGGGALYELELYLSIYKCAGLDPGVYHYSPEKHALYLVSETSGQTERLRREAGVAAQCDTFHALLSIGARFDRVMWKYEALAYSLILKDCGVFMHNFCLACSALGLGSCILGAGPSSLLSRITGKDAYQEGAVGELVFGVPDKLFSPSLPPERVPL
jgi:SagB-type dehydrogenase domain